MGIIKEFTIKTGLAGFKVIRLLQRVNMFELYVFGSRRFRISSLFVNLSGSLCIFRAVGVFSGFMVI